MESIPRTCNTSTDMFKHNVRLEDHFEFRGSLGRTWTYEDFDEDTKYLQRKRRKILLSPKAACEDKTKKVINN